MSASRRDMLDVVLDETDAAHPALAPGAHGDAVPSDPPSDPRRAGHRSARRWWRSDRLQIVAALGGRLLAVVDRPDGGVDVAGLERTTGTTAWRAAARPGGAGDLGTTCALTGWIGPADDASRPAVACVVVDAVTNTSDETLGEQSSPSSARLLVVDATSGAVLADGPTDPTTTVSADGAGLVVSRIGADGRVTVTASDAVGAPDRWTFTSPDPLAADASGRRYAWAVATGHLVVVGSFAMTDQGSIGSHWLLSDDGTVLRTLVADTSTGFAGGPSVLLGGRALAEPGVGDSGQATTTVTDLASGRSFTADALDPGTRPDDGSLGDLLLLQSPTAGDVIGYDLATGRPRWTSPSPGGAGTGVIDGRVLRADSRRLTSIDGRTGETVWSSPLTPADGGAAVDWTTSGRCSPTAASCS